jgi:ribose 5-phosphate isomerase A
MRAPAAAGGSAAPCVTDNGHHLLDCAFGPRDDWPEITRRLEELPGLVGHGIFWECFDVIVVGSESGAEVRHVGRRRV